MCRGTNGYIQLKSSMPYNQSQWIEKRHENGEGKNTSSSVQSSTQVFHWRVIACLVTILGFMITLYHMAFVWQYQM